MRRIGVLALLAGFTMTSAYAAQSYDPAVPGGATTQRIEPSGELAPPAGNTVPPRLVQRNAERHARDADARHCLDQATNNKGIHRCSLKYRSHASRSASVKRASAKSSASAPAPAPAIEITKPSADVVKPGAPRPSDTAKAADLVKPMDVTKPAALPKPVESAKAPEPAKAGPGTPPPPPAKAPEAKK